MPIFNTTDPQNFTLFETLKRLFRVVEHDRSHYVKRFEHLRNMELPEAAQQLASIKDRLVELDILLNKSLEKINLVSIFTNTTIVLVVKRMFDS